MRSNARSEAWENRLCLSFGIWRRIRALIMGVSVRETTAESTMVTASVTANSRNRRPTTSPMNNSGISTAIRAMVSDMMVKPICSAPLSAASSGLSTCSMYRQQEFDLDIGNRGFDPGGQVGERGDLHALGQVDLQLRQQLLDAPDDADGVGARLALHIHDDRGGLVHPGGLAGVLDPIDDPGDVSQHHRCAVAIGHDAGAIVIAVDQLVVGIDLVVLARSVEVALGGVYARLRQRGAQVLQVDA